MELFRANAAIHTNLPFNSTLASAVSAGDTAFTVATGAGALLPMPTNGDYFRLRLGGNASPEVARVTARSGDVCTCDAMTSSFSAGDAVVWTVSGETLETFPQQLPFPHQPPSAPHAANDEFNQAALSSLWTVTGNQTVYSLSDPQGYLSTILSSGQTATFSQSSSVFPSGSFTFVTKLSVNIGSSDYLYASFFGGNNFIRMGVTGWSGYRFQVDTYDNGTINMQRMTVALALYLPVYIKAAFNQSTGVWTFTYSYDCVQWFTLGAHTKAFTPTAFYFEIGSSNANKKFAIDWIRWNW